MNLNPSPDQNHLLDDSGEIVAEFEETGRKMANGNCCNCYLMMKCAFEGYKDYKCAEDDRKDGKNGYWKELSK